MFLFLDRIFWTVFRVSYTCSGNHSVYDGVVYILSLVARTFFCAQSALCVLRTLLMRVAHAWLKGPKKVLCTCVTSLHLAFSSLMSHPSLLFLDGHFETIPDFDVHTFLPYLPVLKAQGMRISARAARSFAIWPSPPSTKVMSPISSTRSLLWTVTRCSLTIQTLKSLTSRKTHTRTLDCSHNV